MTKKGLVNGLIRTVHDILFKNQGSRSTITSSSSFCQVRKVISLGQYVQDNKFLSAITIYKSQGLMLLKAKADIGSKEFIAELTFIAVSYIYSLSDIYFRQFMFDRLQCIKNSSRLQERKTEEERLTSRIAR